MPVDVWYTDTNVWTVLLAGLSLILSQLPPVVTWWRPGRLVIELDERFTISHFLGHPNCQAYLSIRNTGARSVRVTKLRLDVTRPSGALITMPAVGYFQYVNSESHLALFPFSVSAGSEWAHLTNCAERVTESDEHRLNSFISSLQTHFRNIEEGARATNPQADFPPLTPPEIWDQAKNEFDKCFSWERGEYHVQVAAQSRDKEWRSNKYRFTVYETAVTQLKGHVSAYISGDGLLPRRTLPGAQCTLKSL